MAKGIRLHPQHGLNPTMPICFWCGEARGDIALLGAAYKGEAPSHMLLDYTPCKTCRAGMALGIAVIQCDASLKRKPLNANPATVPTGRWCVLKVEAAERMFAQEIWPGIKEVGQVYIDIAAWKAAGLPDEDTQPEP